MSSTSGASPNILKKNSGAANVGTAGGSNVQTELDAKLPLAGGNVTGDVLFNNGIALRWKNASSQERDMLTVNGSSDIFFGHLNFNKIYFDGGSGHEHVWRLGGTQIMSLNANGPELENNKAIRFKNAGGTPYGLISVDPSNNVYFGHATGFGGNLNVDVHSSYIGYLQSGGTSKLNWNTSGVALASGSRVNAILDEDTMSSNSANSLVTQQSIKAYVDNNIFETKASSATASNNTSIDVAIPASAKEVRIKIQNLVPATDEVHLQLLTSTNGGTSFDTGATDYSNTRIQFTSSTTYVQGNAANIQLTSTAVGSDANETGVSGEIIFSRPDQAEYTDIRYSLSHKDGATGSHPTLIEGTARRKSAADVDYARIQFASGNVESGEIQVSTIA